MLLGFSVFQGITGFFEPISIVPQIDPAHYHVGQICSCKEHADNRIAHYLRLHRVDVARAVLDSIGPSLSFHLDLVLQLLFEHPRESLTVAILNPAA